MIINNANDSTPTASIRKQEPVQENQLMGSCNSFLALKKNVDPSEKVDIDQSKFRRINIWNWY